MQHHAQDFCDRAQAAGDVAGALIARQIGFVGLAPALHQASGHAHRDQHFGVAPAGGGEVIAPRRQRHRLLRRRPRQELGDQRQRHQNDGAGQSGDAEQPVKRKADQEVERQPRQIEECARPHAAEKRPDIVEIAQRLQALVATAYQERQPHHGFEHARVEGFVECSSNAAENATANQIEAALRDVEAAGENHEANQGRHAAARQHAVVDLQHENRAGEVQQIDHATHDADADKSVATGAQRFTEFGPPDRSDCHKCVSLQKDQVTGWFYRCFRAPSILSHVNPNPVHAREEGVKTETACLGCKFDAGTSHLAGWGLQAARKRDWNHGHRDPADFDMEAGIARHFRRRTRPPS